jgi:hypothetical protein
VAVGGVQLDLRRPGDRCPRGLQRPDGEPVPGERARIDTGRLVDPAGPLIAAPGREQVEAGVQVELATVDGSADRVRPQHARLGADGIGMGQLGHGGRRGCGGLAVVEPAEPHDGGAHEGAVADPAGVGGRVSARGVQHPSADRARAGACRVEDDPGLRADILRVRAPVEEALGDLVECRIAGQVGAGGRHLRDADGHRGVVAVLARIEAERSAAGHDRLERCRQRRAELVRDAQGVAAGLAEQDAGGAIRVKVHEPPLFLWSFRP